MIQIYIIRQFLSNKNIWTKSITTITKLNIFLFVFIVKSLINLTLLLNSILFFLGYEVLGIDFSLLIIKKLQILKNNLIKMKTIQIKKNFQILIVFFNI